MPKAGVTSFKAKLLRPTEAGATWAFVVLPKTASDTLPRRGRTSVAGTLNGQAFQATLEPDGRLSHWLRIDRKLAKAAHANVGDTVAVHIAPLDVEPEPPMPDDLKRALSRRPAARAIWDVTTTLARVDWIHWIESAHQAPTRQRRVRNACDMLAGGKRRVCCFDPSGYYDQSLRAPDAADTPAGRTKSARSSHRPRVPAP